MGLRGPKKKTFSISVTLPLEYESYLRNDVENVSELLRNALEHSFQYLQFRKIRNAELRAKAFYLVSKGIKQSGAILQTPEWKKAEAEYEKNEELKKKLYSQMLAMEDLVFFMKKPELFQKRPKSHYEAMEQLNKLAEE